MQAKYTDMILLNKWNLISERELDLLLDSVYELNPDTLKIKFETNLSPDLIFGIDTQLFKNTPLHESDKDHHQKEIDILQIIGLNYSKSKIEFENILESFTLLEDVYRIKGFIKLIDTSFILNWAFNRYTLTETEACANDMQLTIMGVSMSMKLEFFKSKFELEDANMKFYSARNE